MTAPRPAAIMLTATAHDRGRVNPLFDTVRDPRLQQVLEADYLELQLALENKMNKASLVLAGGIVEAVLINYLSVVGYEGQPKGRDPKDMQFGELIIACRAEGALTPETAALCQVLKEYRNLVHPGRSARTNEVADLAMVEVAEKLVERVVAGVVERSRKRPEWAAEAALEAAMEPSCGVTAVRRIIRGLADEEAARLVTTVIPDRYAALLVEHGPEDPDDDLYGTEPDGDTFADLEWRAKQCFEQCFEAVPAAVREDAARRLLRELGAGGWESRAWLKTLCSLDVLAALQGREREDLVSFALQAWSNGETYGAARVLRGAGPYLSPASARDLARVVAAPGGSRYQALLKGWTLKSELSRLGSESSEAARKEVDRVIMEWSQHEAVALQLTEMRYGVWPLRDEEFPR